MFLNISLGSDPEGNQHNAYCVLRSIGSVSADENRNTVEVLSRHVLKELGIKSDQFRLFFIDLDPNLVGAKGKIGTDLGLWINLIIYFIFNLMLLF